MKKIFLILIFLVSCCLIFLTTTARPLQLALVNATNIESLDVYYKLDAGKYHKVCLEQCMFPIEFKKHSTSFGPHELKFISHPCQIEQSIKFWNFLRYEINIEFSNDYYTEQERTSECEILLRKSIFPMLYQ